MSMRKDKKPSTVQREETDTRVMAAMEAKPGGLSFAQLSEATGYPMSTVEKSVDRLRRHGFMRKLDGRRRVGRFGNLACVYALGVEEVSEVKRKADADVAAALARARSTDVPVAGIFRIAAIQASWTAEERIAEEQRQASFRAMRKTAAHQREAAA